MPTNDEFVRGLTDSITGVEQTVRNEFGQLNADELNRQPGEGRWSIGQCLDHVMRADRSYFPIFERVRSGENETSIWQRIPFWPRVCGSLVLNAVRPETRNKKGKSPKIFRPSAEPVSGETVENFCRHETELKSIIDGLSEFDLDRVIIPSPVAGFIVYSLRDALTIVVEHQKRHLLQAQAVRKTIEGEAA